MKKAKIALFVLVISALCVGFIFIQTSSEKQAAELEQITSSETVEQEEVEVQEPTKPQTLIWAIELYKDMPEDELIAFLGDNDDLTVLMVNEGAGLTHGEFEMGDSANLGGPTVKYNSDTDPNATTIGAIKQAIRELNN